MSRSPASYTDVAGDASLARSEASAEVFFARFGGRLDPRGRRVLDVGCGGGGAAVHLARHGAAEVVGVDMSGPSIEAARRRVAAEPADVAGRISFRRADRLGGLGGRRFDIVLSKDSFEHFEDPVAMVRDMRACLAPGGILAIGFGPLWKSPYGGHLQYMIALPWAHLLFPEEVLMRERRRFVHEEDDWDGAMRFEDVTGGLNRMTLKRFLAVMDAARMDCTYLATNVHERRSRRVVGLLSRVPPLSEYFTFNVYSLWRPRSEAA